MYVCVYLLLFVNNWSFQNFTFYRSDFQPVGLSSEPIGTQWVRLDHGFRLDHGGHSPRKGVFDITEVSPETRGLVECPLRTGPSSVHCDVPSSNGVSLVPWSLVLVPPTSSVSPCRHLKFWSLGVVNVPYPGDLRLTLLDRYFCVVTLQSD